MVLLLLGMGTPLRVVGGTVRDSSLRDSNRLFSMALSFAEAFIAKDVDISSWLSYASSFDSFRRRCEPICGDSAGTVCRLLASGLVVAARVVGGLVGGLHASELV